MAATTMIHVRVDERINIKAAETLASTGLTVSDAIRVFLICTVADLGDLRWATVGDGLEQLRHARVPTGRVRRKYQSRRCSTLRSKPFTLANQEIVRVNEVTPKTNAGL